VTQINPLEFVETGYMSVSSCTVSHSTSTVIPSQDSLTYVENVKDCVSLW